MKVSIDENLLKELINSHLKLQALEYGGVDNWDWYDLSITEYPLRFPEIANLTIKEQYEYMAEDFFRALIE